VIFGKWSEMILASWIGIELLTDPFSLATTAEIRIRANLLCDIGFRYPWRSAVVPTRERNRPAHRSVQS